MPETTTTYIDLNWDQQLVLGDVATVRLLRKGRKDNWSTVRLGIEAEPEIPIERPERAGRMRGAV